MSGQRFASNHLEIPMRMEARSARAARNMSHAVRGNVSEPVGTALQELYNPVADEAVPFRFGRVLGRLFIATSDLRCFADSKSMTQQLRLGLWK
jgi:hypothetical protein